jgi:hypothetical protein
MHTEALFKIWKSVTVKFYSKGCSENAQKFICQAAFSVLFGITDSFLYAFLFSKPPL